MLVKLKLTNFKQHENLEINFSGGLQVIRGANEAGKSSLFEAIAYAFYGARALPLSIEDTVTWGKPASSLRVELVFSHGGVEYTIKRSKSGAELEGNGVTAAGHAEVTVFIEKLFGASANIGRATMLANQGSLKDGLKSDAMPLIEKLANMQLIDEVISGIQEKLPSGNTKALEVQIQSFSEVAKPEPQFYDLYAEAETAVVRAEQLRTDYNRLSAQETSLKSAAVEAEKVIEQHKRMTVTFDTLQSQLSRLKPTAIKPVKPEADIAAIQAKVAAQEGYTATKRAWDLYKRASPTKFWTGTPQEFVASHEKLVADFTAATEAIRDLTGKVSFQRGRIINETSCGFCGKDLTDVPEVTTANAAAKAEIETLVAEIAQHEARIAAIREERKVLEAWDAEVTKQSKQLPITHVEVDQTTVPYTLKWVGPNIAEIESDDSTDWRSKLREAEGQLRSYERAEAAYEQTITQVTELEQQISELDVPILCGSESEAVAAYAEWKRSISSLKSEMLSADHEAQLAKTRIVAAQEAYDIEVKRWEEAEKRRADMLSLLDTYNFHNGIIRKLRDARPVVAKKLWNLVNAGVSHYFSLMRGTSSTVTRAEDTFMIDGKSAAAYSGSTKDILGLSIRLMLQKTFLPNVAFMLVDEPAAACSDERETEMLAVLAGCGLDQVILVTHSDLADSFAANVIQI